MSAVRNDRYNTSNENIEVLKSSLKDRLSTSLTRIGFEILYSNNSVPEEHPGTPVFKKMERFHSLENEINSIVSEHLSIKNVDTRESINKEIEKQTTQLEKINDTLIKVPKLTTAFANKRNLLNKQIETLNNSLIEITETNKTNKSIIDELDGINDLKGLLTLSATKGLYYLFKFTFVVNKLPIEKELLDRLTSEGTQKLDENFYSNMSLISTKTDDGCHYVCELPSNTRVDFIDVNPYSNNTNGFAAIALITPNQK